MSAPNLRYISLAIASLICCLLYIKYSDSWLYIRRINRENSVAMQLNIDRNVTLNVIGDRPLITDDLRSPRKDTKLSLNVSTDLFAVKTYKGVQEITPSEFPTHKPSFKSVPVNSSAVES